MNTKERFAKNIKRIRLSFGLTQEQFAEKVGLQTFQTVSNLENAKNIATPETMDKICEVFGIDIVELFSKVPDEKAASTEILSSINALLSTFSLDMLDKVYKIIHSLK